MIKALLLAVWASVLSLSANYAVAYWKAHNASPAEAKTTHALEQRKTRIINVPILADGAVQGYVVAQFAYTGDAAALKAASVAPDGVLLDEAFRLLYADEKTNFRKLQRADLDKIVKTLLARVTARVPPELVKEILVQELNYVANDEIRK
ncbi:MAG: hypothetical protein ACK5JM_03515 [Rhodoblastus sp.]